MDCLRGNTAPQGRHYRPQPQIRGFQRIGIDVGAESPFPVFPEKCLFAEFQGTYRFLESRFKGTVDGHHFPGGFHLRAQQTVAAGKFIKRPARDFHHDVVECRFECRHCFAGDRIGDFIQPFAHGDFRSDAGDGVTRRFTGQRRTAADTGIDFDNIISFALRVEGILHVAAAFDTQFADYFQTGGAQHLIFFIRQCLAGRHDNTISGVNAHRVDVFHIADGNAVIAAVAHYFIFQFFPAGH